MPSTGSRLDKKSSTAAHLPAHVDGLTVCKYLTSESYVHVCYWWKVVLDCAAVIRMQKSLLPSKVGLH